MLTVSFPYKLRCISLLKILTIFLEPQNVKNYVHSHILELPEIYFKDKYATENVKNK